MDDFLEQFLNAQQNRIFPIMFVADLLDRHQAKGPKKSKCPKKSNTLVVAR